MLKSLFQFSHGHLEDKTNTFTALRIGFALLILYGHAIMIPIGLPITGAWPVFIDTIVQFALDGFFILSGYMIASSVMRSTDLTSYSLSRVLRIFPGLIVTTLILWIVVGPLFSELSFFEYWSSAQTWAFPLLVIGQGDPMAGLPEVFNASPLISMNGPLWTIRYELLAYVGIGILTAFGLFQHSRMILMWAALFAVASVIHGIFGYEGIGSATVESMMRFGTAFLIGSAFFAARDKINLAPGYVILIIMAAFALQNTTVGPLMTQMAVAWTVLTLGYFQFSGGVGSSLRNVEDVSYGIYIMHWPIGMMAFALIPEASSTLLFVIMLPVSIVSAWLLRVFVEKPALAMKPAIRNALYKPKPVAAE
jgi:peptidoglycan/LPS O-acetylase OafA/YrhL